MTQKFVFNRKGSLNHRGRALIQHRLTHQKKTYYISTGIYIEPKHWDSNKERVKKTHPKSVRLNGLLFEKRQFADHYHDHNIKNFNLYSLVKLLRGEKESDPENVFTFFWEAYESYKERIQDATLKQHRNLLKYLYKYNKNLSFDDIGVDFRSEFESWLMQQETYRGDDFSTNYRALLLRILRRYVNEARKKGKISVDVFLNEKIETEETTKDFLTGPELSLIDCLDVSNRRGFIPESKDMFVFSCYTGLRFSDAISLTRKHIVHDGRGYRLKKILQKTKKKKIKINLPLYTLFNGKPQELILNRINTPSPYDEIFGPFESHFTKTYNDHLKLFAKLTGIEKNLSSHVARHTCAMMLLNDFGASFETVQAVLGHTSIATTQRHYAKLLTRGLDNRLENVFK